MSKINIGATLALYPCPVIVVGAMVNDRPTWTLVAHAGTVAHSHLMVSLVQAHYINQGIRETKRLSVNVVDESWLAKADRMGTVSGNRVDKSGEFAWTMGENGAPSSTRRRCPSNARWTATTSWSTSTTSSARSSRPTRTRRS